MSLPTVSVVVVNYNGLKHLEPCFSSLMKQSYPATLLEFILIDNNSHDGSRKYMSEHFPDVKVVHNADNVGFAAAVNQAAYLAQGSFIALLNNDAYADPDWLLSLIECLSDVQDESVVCVGSVMYDWHGQKIDFARAGVNFYGYGDQFFHDAPKDSVNLQRQEVLMACGGAMLVDRAVFIELGGFDPDFFAYFEDLDFGWRLWLAGYKAILEPRSFVYHRSHGTSSAFRVDQMHMLYQRNALATIIKNYADDSLQQTLPAALLLLIHKAIDSAGENVPWEQFDMRYQGQHDLILDVPRSAFAYLAAARDIINNFEFWWSKREAVQRLRKKPDQAILPLFEAPMAAFSTSPGFAHLHHTLIDTLGLSELFGDTKQVRVLVVSGDPLYETIAGSGMRALEMARVLSEVAHVTLAAPERADVDLPGVTTVAFTAQQPELMKRLAADADVLVLNAHIAYSFPAFLVIRRILVIDMYVPAHFENLDSHMKNQASLNAAADKSFLDVEVINLLLQLGDFFICASERQRDMWLGWLSQLKRVTPSGYRKDPSFRSLIDVVPFGLSDVAPVATQSVLKGVVPGINHDDTVLLWNGGIWDWFDPLTLIHAMVGVREQRPDVKLFFMGARHPNAAVPDMKMYDQAVQLARSLGLYGQTVFFNPNWVPYAERQQYLLEADWSICTYADHVETRFAFRTRVLDCFWAALPLIVNSGDVLSDYIREHDLGYVVPPGQVEKLVDGILQAVAESHPSARRQSAFEQAQSLYAWSQTLQPLVNFCRHPRFAADYTLHTTYNDLLGYYQRLYDLQLRNMWLDEVVESKQQHVRYLEHYIQQLQQGRVMQGAEMLKRLLKRS